MAFHRNATSESGSAGGSSSKGPNGVSKQTPFPASWTSMCQTHKVALYDFQYIGVGVPTQDLIKYLCCVVPTRHLSSQADEKAWLSFYHSRLAEHLASYAREQGRSAPSVGLEREYPMKRLLEDFDLSLLSWVRFTEGWGGGAWGNVRWLHKRARSLLEEHDDQQWLKGIRSRWSLRRKSEEQ